ncbi:MAG: APC family permease [Kiloniellales bacterium]
MSASTPRSDPGRRLGLWSAAALVVANMVGAGVFTTSGFALGDLGSREVVLWAWAVGGLLATCGALSYGALARRIPESGGEYTFLSVTVHPLAGFLAGWISLLAGFTAPIAAAALALQAYLGPVLDAELDAEWSTGWLGTGAILAAGAMHGLRLREGVVAQNIAVAVKLVAIAVFVVMGAARLPEVVAAPGPAPPFELGAFAVTLIWISFSYSGWNAAVYVAGEVRNPQRNLQRSLLLATGLVTAVYLALNAVFVYAAPVSALAGVPDVGGVAAEHLGGPGLRAGLSVLVSLALFTSISSMVMAGPRVYARMAEDGLFPAIFGRRGDVPGAAVALQVVLAIAVVWLTELRDLLSYIGFTLGLSAAATVVGLMVLRRREGPERVPVPGYPWVPLLFVGTTLAASGFLVQRQPLEAAFGLLTAASGIPLYFLFWRIRRFRQRA